jgi:TIR domain/Pentapeptide repeats (8 copies)
VADPELLQILRQGAIKWNEWRREHEWVVWPDFSGALLFEASLSGADLSRTNFIGANLTGAQLEGANFSGTSLSGAKLADADLSYARLDNSVLLSAVLLRADLHGADFTRADLSRADLSDAKLLRTNLSGAILRDTIFDHSSASGTVFVDLDLRGAVGLETVGHVGPSDVGLNTIYKSEGKISEAFLLGCGVQESFITQIQALVGAVQPIQFHSCFISYSEKDMEFAKRLHERMRREALRVWFAPEDMKGGDYLKDQIDRAIQVHDRLLLVLSERSMQSDWVRSEILQARRVEKKEGRRKLFPIRLANFESVKGWECFDPDEGTDLAKEVRRYYIPDFSNWKNHDAFEREFNRLYESLKAEA